MKRAVLITTSVLFAGVPVALAQIPGAPGFDMPSFGTVGTFTGDMMSGKDLSVTGIKTRVSADSATRLRPMEDPLAARDGCINYPGRAHNSADCSLLTTWDPTWVVPNKPLSEMTGAEENMLRSYNLLHDQPFRFSYKR